MHALLEICHSWTIETAAEKCSVNIEVNVRQQILGIVRLMTTLTGLREEKTKIYCRSAADMVSASESIMGKT